MNKLERLARIQILNNFSGKIATSGDIVKKTLKSTIDDMNSNDQNWIASQFHILYQKGITNVNIDLQPQGSYYSYIRFKNCPFLSPNATDELENLKRL